MRRPQELRMRSAVANWYGATLMHPVTADPRITGVPYSPIALRTGVDWAERRTVQVRRAMRCEAPPQPGSRPVQLRHAGVGDDDDAAWGAVKVNDEPSLPWRMRLITRVGGQCGGWGGCTKQRTMRSERQHGITSGWVNRRRGRHEPMQASDGLTQTEIAYSASTRRKLEQLRWIPTVFVRLVAPSLVWAGWMLTASGAGRAGRLDGC